MEKFNIKMLLFIYRNGVTLLSKDGKSVSDDSLIGGFFTALNCCKETFRERELIPRFCSKVEIWFNTTLCIIDERELYTFVAFVNNMKRNDPHMNALNDIFNRITKRFEVEYKSILEKWDRDLSRFDGFKTIIDEIIQKEI